MAKSAPSSWPHGIENDLTRFPGTRGVAVAGALLLSLVEGSTAASGQVQSSGLIKPAGLIAQSFDLRSTPSAMIQPAVRAATPSGPAMAIPALTIPPPPLIPLPTRPRPLAPQLIPDDVAALTSALPLAALVDANSSGELDAEANCLATAVYFESKGEPLEGQLAVAQVVLNRAASGRYPASLCGVVRQHAQFSFVRAGVFPRIDPDCAAWRKARAIARIAQKRLGPSLPTDVLWYHANYVAPRWRQALTIVNRIGAHIFYRA
ncbi:MAG: cell wall hydrolase [Sphingomicrobium sp.]